MTGFSMCITKGVARLFVLISYSHANLSRRGKINVTDHHHPSANRRLDEWVGMDRLRPDVDVESILKQAREEEQVCHALI